MILGKDLTLIVVIIMIVESINNVVVGEVAGGLQEIIGVIDTIIEIAMIQGIHIITLDAIASTVVVIIVVALTTQGITVDHQEIWVLTNLGAPIATSQCLVVTPPTHRSAFHLRVGENIATISNLGETVPPALLFDV